MYNEQLPAPWQALWQQEGFVQPSLIQEKSFPLLFGGQDVLGVSPTGSGKTLAYLLPLLLKIEKGQGGQLLVLASSQELAMQVVTVAKKWAAGLGLSVVSLIGGANVRRQVEKLKQRPEVLIGTPGRVWELINDKKIKAHHLKAIVFDEVDQLLEGQSLQLIKQIRKAAPNECQKVYFSATGDRAEEQIRLFEPAITVLDVTQEDDSQGQIKHYYLLVASRKKNESLRHLANTPAFYSLIFFNQLSDLDAAEQRLAYRGLLAATLASDQSAAMRKFAIHQFKEQKAQLLLTTDVAARGLDITGLQYVVNYELPLDIKSYIHRSGRVGRMGNDGTVITLIAPQEAKAFRQMLRKADLEAAEIFVYGGALHTEAPVVTKTEQSRLSAVSIPEKTRSEKRSPRSEAIEKKEPKRNKQRHKNKKNKGARRK